MISVVGPCSNVTDSILSRLRLAFSGLNCRIDPSFYLREHAKSTLSDNFYEV